jgi:general secretion pathway protein D
VVPVPAAPARLIPEAAEAQAEDALTVTSFSSAEASVTADENTNTIIVVASPAIQRVYEQLIERLDQRRPQVLIETTVVTLDTSGNFSLGVEISQAGRFNTGGGEDAFGIGFSSFGLSAVDLDTGALTIDPAVGFNGAVISPEIANVVLQAFKSSGRGSVSAAPRILVNDNATGTLDSVLEAPTTVTDTSNSVSTTTSFGGFESAGTNISMTPRIAEGDYLKLEFSVTLSGFTGEASSSAVPPPRQTNAIQSEVTVPDGYTVVVGGLNRTDESSTNQRVPILGDLPLIKYLFRSTSENQTQSTLFVFIKPVILRDDDFTDLKYLSSVDRRAAGIPGDHPESRPMPVY